MLHAAAMNIFLRLIVPWVRAVNRSTARQAARRGGIHGRPHPFWFRDVARADKAGLVREVFTSVAGRYDPMNDLMSGGVHRLWKDALDWLAPRPDQHLLDVAGGTGDIAFRFLERGGGQVTVCDINADMIAAGQARAGTACSATR